MAKCEHHIVVPSIINGRSLQVICRSDEWQTCGKTIRTWNAPETKGAKDAREWLELRMLKWMSHNEYTQVQYGNPSWRKSKRRSSRSLSQLFGYATSKEG